MNSDIKELYSNDDKKSYKKLLELEELTKTSNYMYKYFNIFITNLNSKKTYERLRSFRMICALSLWDSENLIENNIDIILKAFNDTIPSNIRQYIQSIYTVIDNKTNLKEKILNKISKIDTRVFKESMSSLIEKDKERIILKYKE